MTTASQTASTTSRLEPVNSPIRQRKENGRQVQYNNTVLDRGRQFVHRTFVRPPNPFHGKQYHQYMMRTNPNTTSYFPANVQQLQGYSNTTSYHPVNVQQIQRFSQPSFPSGHYNDYNKVEGQDGANRSSTTTSAFQPLKKLVLSFSPATKALRERIGLHPSSKASTIEATALFQEPSLGGESTLPSNNDKENVEEASTKPKGDSLNWIDSVEDSIQKDRTLRYKAQEADRLMFRLCNGNEQNLRNILERLGKKHKHVFLQPPPLLPVRNWLNLTALPHKKTIQKKVEILDDSLKEICSRNLNLALCMITEWLSGHVQNDEAALDFLCRLIESIEVNMPENVFVKMLLERVDPLAAKIVKGIAGFFVHHKCLGSRGKFAQAACDAVACAMFWHFTEDEAGLGTVIRKRLDCENINRFVVQRAIRTVSGMKSSGARFAEKVRKTNKNCLRPFMESKVIEFCHDDEYTRIDSFGKKKVVLERSIEKMEGGGYFYVPGADKKDVHPSRMWKFTGVDKMYSEFLESEYCQQIRDTLGEDVTVSRTVFAASICPCVQPPSPQSCVDRILQALRWYCEAYRDAIAKNPVVKTHIFLWMVIEMAQVELVSMPHVIPRQNLSERALKNAAKMFHSALEGGFPRVLDILPGRVQTTIASFLFHSTTANFLSSFGARLAMYCASRVLVSAACEPEEADARFSSFGAGPIVPEIVPSIIETIPNLSGDLMHPLKKFSQHLLGLERLLISPETYIEDFCCKPRSHPKLCSPGEINPAKFLSWECGVLRTCEHCIDKRPERHPIFSCPALLACEEVVVVHEWHEVTRNGENRTNLEDTEVKLTVAELNRKLVEHVPVTMKHVTQFQWQKKNWKRRVLHMKDYELFIQTDFSATPNLKSNFLDNCDEANHAVLATYIVISKPRRVPIIQDDDSVTWERTHSCTHWSFLGPNDNKGKSNDHIFHNACLKEVVKHHIEDVQRHLGVAIKSVYQTTDNCAAQYKSQYNIAVTIMFPKLFFPEVSLVHGYAIRFQFKGVHDSEGKRVKQKITNLEKNNIRIPNAKAAFKHFHDDPNYGRPRRDWERYESDGDPQLLQKTLFEATEYKIGYCTHHKVEVEEMITQGYKHVVYCDRESLPVTCGEIKGSTEFHEVRGRLDPVVHDGKQGWILEHSDMSCSCNDCLVFCRDECEFQHIRQTKEIIVFEQTEAPVRKVAAYLRQHCGLRGYVNKAAMIEVLTKRGQEVAPGESKNALVNKLYHLFFPDESMCTQAGGDSFESVVRTEARQDEAVQNDWEIEACESEII